jgi:hypothetical protein
MDIDHAGRDRLYRRAVEVLGREEAETLMASLPPMDSTQIVTKDYLDLRLEALEHRLSANFESALRRQTQWVFAAVVIQTVGMVLGIISALTLA